MLNSEEKFNIIKQSIAGQIEGPAYEAIQAAEQQALQKTEEEAPQSEQQTQTQQTPVGLPPAQTIPRVYDSQGSLIEPGSTGIGLNQMAGTSPGQTIQPGEYKTGGPKSKAPKPLTESDAKLEEEWPEMLKKQRFVESGFNTNAKSGAGATGSAQIMPDTLDYAKMKGWVPETIGMKDLTGASGHSISKHIQEKYMENLFNRSWNKGTNEAKKAKALLAYNWGPENTRVKLNKLIDKGVNVWDNTDFTKYFNEESRQYKGKILDDLTTKKDPHVQRDYKKLKDLSPLLRMHGGPKVLYNNKKLKK
jgi:hypothetical protein|tara:strand:+ start:936 stop:1850 length:915 start_codon:yes stop_codon:yes gene_type:complete